jgi:PQQ-like domain
VPVAAPSDAADAAPWPMALFDARHTGTSSATGPGTGHVEWTRDLGGNITPGPVVGADGTIYVATNAGVLHALDSSTGADQWTFTGQGTSTGPGQLSTSPLVLLAGDVLWPGPAQHPPVPPPGIEQGADPGWPRTELTYHEQRPGWVWVLSIRTMARRIRAPTSLR